MLLAAALYAVLSLALVAPALVPGHSLASADVSWFLPPWASSKPASLVKPSDLELGDARDYYYPVWQYAKDQMPHVPLWNPYLMAGRPFLANDQSDVFSPYSVPTYVLPFWRSLAWMTALKLWVAAFGAFLLARALGLRRGALLAGVVYAFNLWMVSWLLYPASSVWSFTPWLLLAVERLVRRPDPASGGLLATIVGLQFLSGHAESDVHSVLFATLFFAFRLVGKRRAGGWARAPTARSLLLFLGGLAAGVALAAVVLLPFLELLFQSADNAQRASTLLDEHIRITDGLEMFFATFWGKPTGVELQLFLFTRALYAGALPLLLAVAALVIRRDRVRLFFAIYGLVALVTAIGVPPFTQIVTRLPVLKLVHTPYVVVNYMLCLGLLAGWGLDDLSQLRASVRQRRVLLALAVGLLVVPLVAAFATGQIATLPLRRALDVAWGFATAAAPNPITNPHGADVIHLASMIIWVTMAGLSGLLVIMRLWRRLPALAFTGLALILVAADLFRAGMGLNPTISESYVRQPATPAIMKLQAQRPRRFVPISPSPLDIEPNIIPLDFRLYNAGGYDFPVIDRFFRFWHSQIAPQQQNLTLQVPAVTPQALHALRLLSVSNLVQASNDPQLRLPGLSLAYAGNDARVYHLAGALPRTFLVSDQQIVHGAQAALGAVASPSFTGQRVAVSEQAIPGIPSGEPAQSSVPRGATLTRYEPERVTVSARSARTSLLILTDTYYPGWQATVDGKSEPIYRVDDLFRGVVVPSGTHTIDFRYRPASWTAGWIVTLSTLACLALTAALSLRRRGKTARRQRSTRTS